MVISIHENRDTHVQTCDIYAHIHTYMHIDARTHAHRDLPNVFHVRTYAQLFISPKIVEARTSFQFYISICKHNRVLGLGHRIK